MDIDTVDVNNETKKVNLLETIKEDKTNDLIKDYSTKTNLWIPKDYDNCIENASGKTKIDNPGFLQFYLKPISNSFNLFKRYTKVKLTLKSSNLVKYNITPKDTDNLIEQDHEDTNVYYLTIIKPESFYTISVLKEDVLQWELTTIDNQKVEFQLLFTHNYLTMLESKLTENKQLTSKLSNYNRIIKKLQFKLNETKNELKVNKMKQQQAISIQQEKQKLQKNLKDATISLSLLKIEEANKRIKAKQYQQDVQKCNNEIEQLIHKINQLTIQLHEKTSECTLLQTSINKYRTENKKIIVELNDHKQELLKLEKSNADNVKEAYYLNFELNELSTELSKLKNENKSLHDVIHDLELDNSVYKLDVDDLTIEKDKMIDEYDSKMIEHEELMTELQEKNENLTKENIQLTKENDHYLSVKNELENKLIDSQLTVTELELKNECLLNKKKCINKLDLLSKINEIFDWYKNALPDKRKINSIMANLESEVISTIQESK